MHVFLEWNMPAGLSRESGRLPLSGTEACLGYYDIRLIEKFWSVSGERLIYHFVAPDAVWKLLFQCKRREAVTALLQQEAADLKKG